MWLGKGFRESQRDAHANTHTHMVTNNAQLRVWPIAGQFVPRVHFSELRISSVKGGGGCVRGLFHNISSQLMASVCLRVNQSETAKEAIASQQFAFRIVILENKIVI